MQQAIRHQDLIHIILCLSEVIRVSNYQCLLCVIRDFLYFVTYSLDETI